MIFYPIKSIHFFLYHISLISRIWYELQQHVQDEIQTHLSFCLISVESKKSKNYSYVLHVYYLLDETILFHFSYHISSMIVNVNTIRIKLLLKNRILHKYHRTTLEIWHNKLFSVNQSYCTNTATWSIYIY